MQNRSVAIALLLMMGQPLSAQTHTTKPTSKPLAWYTQTGAGISGEFEIKSATSANAALYATTNGTGVAGSFIAGGSGYGLISQAASGVGGYFLAYGSNEAIYGESTYGTGGYFASDGSNDGVYGVSNSGNGGHFYSQGPGYGAFGESSQGVGVYGVGHSNIGVYGVTGGGAAGVYGYNISSNGSGVSGYGEVGVQGTTTDSVFGLAGLFEGGIEVDGTVYASSYVTNSDARYKTHITPLNHALDKVLALRGVTYDWRADQFPDKRFGKGQQVGFIAQEVEKILPQIVTKDRNGYRAVDYSKVVPVLVEAIKEQQAQIQEQTNLNNAYLRRIAAIEAEVRHAQMRALLGKAPALGALLALGVGSGLALSRRRPGADPNNR
jgi:hypothetical protein